MSWFEEIGGNGSLPRLYFDTCLNCEAIDSVSWKRPPQSESVSAEMLPLIVGQMAKVDQGVTSVLSDNETKAISETSVEDKQKKS